MSVTTDDVSSAFVMDWSTVAPAAAAAADASELSQDDVQRREKKQGFVYTG
jgi:hypothetical protein